MIYQTIIEKVEEGKKQFVVLIDPEAVTNESLHELLDLAQGFDVDFFLLGGSTYAQPATDVLQFIRSKSDLPVVLFPGNASQITPGVDAVLFLSLISGTNPEYLISNHIKAAPLLTKVEVIPVGYILIDGGRQSATEIVSHTMPLSRDNVDVIVHTAMAGELLGHKMIYLEAGSGAKMPISAEIVQRVKASISIPLIVGGGIVCAEMLNEAFASGADIVVVGNVLEKKPQMLSLLVDRI